MGGREVPDWPERMMAIPKVALLLDGYSIEGEIVLRSNRKLYFERIERGSRYSGTMYRIGQFMELAEKGGGLIDTSFFGFIIPVEDVRGIVYYPDQVYDPRAGTLKGGGIHGTILIETIEGLHVIYAGVDDAFQMKAMLTQLRRAIGLSGDDWCFGEASHHGSAYFNQ